jgi:hypothetical protein
MKKHISLLFGLSLLTNVCIAGDWTERYTPTRAEWLEYVVKRDISRWTDLWRTRVALNVMVIVPRKEVAIVVTPANGEEDFTPATCDNYKAIIKQSAENTLRKFSWANGAKIKVECV